MTKQERLNIIKQQLIELEERIMEDERNKGFTDDLRLAEREALESLEVMIRRNVKVHKAIRTIIKTGQQWLTRDWENGYMIVAEWAIGHLGLDE